MFFALKLATIINFVSNQTVSNIQQMYFSSGLEIRHQDIECSLNVTFLSQKRIFCSFLIFNFLIFFS